MRELYHANCLNPQVCSGSVMEDLPDHSIKSESCSSVMRELYASSNNSEGCSSARVVAESESSSMNSLRCVNVWKNCFNNDSFNPSVRAGLVNEPVQVRVKTEPFDPTYERCQEIIHAATTRSVNEGSQGCEPFGPSNENTWTSQLTKSECMIKEEHYEPELHPEAGAQAQITNSFEPSNKLDLASVKSETVHPTLDPHQEGGTQVQMSNSFEPSSLPSEIHVVYTTSEPHPEGGAEAQITNPLNINLPAESQQQPRPCSPSAEISVHFPVQRMAARRHSSPYEGCTDLRLNKGDNGCPGDLHSWDTSNVYSEYVIGESDEMDGTDANDKVDVDDETDEISRESVDKDSINKEKVADRCTSSADREIRDWVLKQRDDKQPVTRSALREYARRTMKKPGFKASISWLKSFLKRNDLEKVVQRGQETDCGKQPLRGIYKSYTLEQKTKAIQLAEKNSCRFASEQLQIPFSTVFEWKKVYKARPVENKRVRKVGYDVEIDRRIRDWVLQRKSDNQPVTRSALCEYARQAVNQPNFKASDSWMRRFLQRHDLFKVVTCNSVKCRKDCNFGSHCALESVDESSASSKPYACGICGKRFAHPSRLKRHVAIHTE